MRYATSSDTEPKLAALLEAAREEAVFFERGQQKVAVLVSVSEYDRLRNAANSDFQELCDSLSDKAMAQGFTEEELNDLLSNA